MTVEEILNETPAEDRGRACFLLRVKPEMLEEYLEAHQHVWPRMQEALKASGFRHYSLFLEQDSGLVVGYFEADDTGVAMELQSAKEIDQIWQAEMSRYFQEPDGGTSKKLRQYFYLS